MLFARSNLNQQYQQNTPFICYGCSVLFGFVFSIATTVWSFISLLLVVTTFSGQPDKETWNWMLWLTIWALTTGIIFVVDLLVASQKFDLWLTAYLMITWLAFTGLAVWKTLAWLKLGSTNVVYVHFAHILMAEAAFMNVVYVLAAFFPHDLIKMKKSEKSQYPIGYVYQPVILIR